MAEYTQNYNLKKPDEEDFYNVKDFNDNADIIDQALKAHDDALATKETPQGAQEKANAALNSAKQYTDQEVGEVAQELAAHKAEDVTQGNTPHGIIYEEGTWTPALYSADTDGEFSQNIGTYTRIGNRCFVEFQISFTTPPTGNVAIAITGFPFPRESGQPRLAYVFAENTPLRDGDSYSCGLFSASGTLYANFMSISADGNARVIRYNDITQDSILRGKFSYLIRE